MAFLFGLALATVQPQVASLCEVWRAPKDFMGREIVVTGEIVDIQPHGIVVLDATCDHGLAVDPRALGDDPVWDDIQRKIGPLITRQRTQAELTGSIRRVRDVERRSGWGYVLELNHVANPRPVVSR